MCSSPHWQVGLSWFREKLSPANREQRLSRWADFAKNCLPRIGSKELPRFREKYRALGRQKMGSNMRPRYIQFRDIRDRDISGLHCTFYFFAGVLYNTEPLDYSRIHNYILEVRVEDCGKQRAKQSNKILINIKIKQACKAGWRGEWRFLFFLFFSLIKVQFRGHEKINKDTMFWWLIQGSFCVCAQPMRDGVTV